MSLTIARIRALFSIVDPEADELLTKYDQGAEINTSYVSILNVDWMEEFVTKDVEKEKIEAFLNQLIADDVEQPCLLELFLQTLSENHELKQILRLHTCAENAKLASLSSIGVIKKKVNTKIDVYIKNILEAGDVHTIILPILNTPVLKSRALELHSDLLIFDGHGFITLRELADKLDRADNMEIDASSWELQKLLAEITSKKIKSKTFSYERQQQEELLKKCDTFLKSATDKQKETFFSQIHINYLIAYIQLDLKRIRLLVDGVTNRALVKFCNVVIPRLRGYDYEYISIRCEMINIIADQLLMRQNLAEQEKQQIIMLFLRMILEYPLPKLDNGNSISEGIDHYSPDSKTKALFFINMVAKIEEDAKPSLIDSIVKQYGGSTSKIELDIKLIKALLAKGCECDLELAMRECGKEGFIAILEHKKPSVEVLERLLISSIKNNKLLNYKLIKQRLLQTGCWNNIALVTDGEPVWDIIEPAFMAVQLIDLCDDEKKLITMQEKIKKFVDYLSAIVVDGVFHLQSRQAQQIVLYKFLAAQPHLCKEIYFRIEPQIDPGRYDSTKFIDVDKDVIAAAVANNNIDFILLLLKRVQAFPALGSIAHQAVLKDAAFTLYKNGADIQPILDHLHECRGFLYGTFGVYNPFKTFEEKLFEELTSLVVVQPRYSELIRFSSKHPREKDVAEEQQPLLAGLKGPGV